MEASYGNQTDWYRKLAEHPASVHKATMLRNYAAAWRTWQKFSEEVRGNLKGIGISHVSKVLAGRYTAEDREIHLRYAVEHPTKDGKVMPVRGFEAYLKEKGKAGPATDAGTAATEAADHGADDTSTHGCEPSVGDLLSAINRTYGHLVGVHGRLGGHGIPAEVPLALGNLVRFAVAYGFLSREELLGLAEVKPVPAGPALDNRKDGLTKAG